MWKDSNRNIVVIFQTNILRIVGFYVRHSAHVKKRLWLVDKRFFGLRACFTFTGKIYIIGGSRGLKLGVQWVDPQRVSQLREGTWFWG